MNAKSFGQALARERAAHQFEAVSIAAAARITIDEYAAIERGDVLPTLEVAQALADALGIPLDSLTNASYIPPIRMGKEDDIDPNEKQREWAAYEAAREHRYAVGKRIMIGIIIVEVVSLILNLFFTSILATVLLIIMLVFLWRGRTWARYIYAGLCVLAAITNLVQMPRLSSAPIVLAIVVLITVYQLAAGALVCFNSSVEEFLSEQNSQY